MSANTRNTNFKTHYLDISQDPFMFNVNGQIFKCNIFGVNVSNVIRKIREKNPEIKHYDYYSDIDPSSFQDICNIFNFKKVPITVKNMRSLLKISEDLQIDILLNDLYNFIETYELSLQDSEIIDELFQWLYQIESLTVKTVENSIIESIWCHTEENVQELAAAILQVVRTSYKLHPYLIELMTSLEESADEKNNLHLLIPFITKQLIFSFQKSVLYCSFLYKLIKIGRVSIEKVIHRIFELDGFLTQSDKAKKKEQTEFDESFDRCNHCNAVIWFLPEILKSEKKVGLSEIFNGLEDNEVQFILLYSENIENYKKMRDSGEPDDELTLAILHDDVDNLQRIISNYNLDINKEAVPINIYDVFDRNIEKSYINYAAQCGSVKSFKYLLLNHAKIDELSLGFAVFGGNTEIIRIIEQQIIKNRKVFYNRNKNTSVLQSFYRKSNYLGNYQTQITSFSLDINCVMNPLIPSIITHNYELFTWVLDSRFAETNVLDANVLVNVAAQNGNAYSFIKFMDKKLFTTIQYQKLVELIFLAAKSGFFRLIQFLFKLNNIEDMVFTNKLEDLQYSSVYFGNLSIFKLLINSNKSSCNFEKLLEFAIKREHVSIIKYIFEALFMPKEKKFYLNIFKNAVDLETSTIFNYFDQKISLFDLKNNFNFNIKNFASLLKNSCKSGNFECIQKLTDFIINEYPNSDFTDHLICAAENKSEKICQYFFDKKVIINAANLINSYQYFMFAPAKLIDNLINYLDSYNKEKFSKLFLQEAIKTGNYDIVNLLISKDLLNKYALFDAVKSDNSDIVNRIVQINNKPSFINQISKGGSALNIAVTKNNVEIVRILLKLDNINVNLYEQTNGETPLTMAITNENTQIAKMLIEHPKTDINLKNNGFLSPLILAIHKNLEDIISLLINNQKFDPDESELNYAFFISEGKIAHLLYSVEGLDVNYQDEPPLFETTLHKAYLKNDLDKMELIITHKSFDPNKSRIKEIVFDDSKTLNEDFIIKHFDKIINDVNMEQNGKSFFMFSYEGKNYEIIKEIMKKETFNPNKEEFNNVFIDLLRNLISSPNEEKENLIQLMIEYDENHNHIIDYSTTILYLAVKVQNEQIINIIKKKFEAKTNENAKFSVLPSFNEPGIIYQLKKMEKSPFDRLFIASQSSGDIYNLIDVKTEDCLSLYCNEKCFIDFEFEEQISINGIYLFYENQDFMNLFDIFIDDNQIEANFEILDNGEITISFDTILCKKLSFKIKDHFGNDLKNDFITLNGIELFSTDEKYSKGVFATFIENNEFHDPHKCPVVISSSSYDFNSFYLPSSSHGISTFDENDSWFQVEFTESLVILNGFRLKRNKLNKLKGFKVFCTDDVNNPIEKWSTLIEVNEIKSNEFKAYDIFQFQQQSEPTKVVRIIQTKPNWKNNFHLIFAHIDFFGFYL